MENRLEKLKKTKAFMLLPTTKSKDIEWINWMKILDKDFDRDTSVALFVKLWGKGGTSDARTLQLRQFMQDKYNLNLSEGILDNVVDLGGDIGDTMSGIFKVGKITFFVVGGIVVFAIGAAIYSIIKNPSNAMMLTPAGRAAKMMGGK